MRIEVLERRKQDLLEKMNIELSSLKSSIDDYKKMIRREFDDKADLIHLRDSCEWIDCQYNRFMEARVEFLELKSYLLGYEDAKIERTKDNA